MKILILCTGNSCRSQMAEGYLRYLKPHWEIFSAGTHPEKEVNPYAVEVMRELGISLDSHSPESVNKYVYDDFDYVITVCDDAKEKCPHFPGKVKHRLHHGFEDPALFKGPKEEVLMEYRRIRDQIREVFSAFALSVKE